MRGTPATEAVSTDMCGGHHRELAARNVAAHGLHRDIPVAQDDARQGLDLDVGHGGPLGPGEGADLVLGEADVGHLAVGDPLPCIAASISETVRRKASGE